MSKLQDRLEALTVIDNTLNELQFNSYLKDSELAYEEIAKLRRTIHNRMVTVNNQIKRSTIRKTNKQTYNLITLYTFQ